MNKLGIGDYFQVLRNRSNKDRSYTASLMRVESISNGVILATKYDINTEESVVAICISEYEIERTCDHFVNRFLSACNVEKRPCVCFCVNQGVRL